MIIKSNYRVIISRFSLKKVLGLARQFKQIEHDDEKIVEFVETTPEVRVLIAMPGDVVVIRPLDHHAVLTVYVEKPGFGPNDRYAMAIGSVFVRREDIGDAVR